jgi:hypothetical protein
MSFLHFCWRVKAELQNQAGQLDGDSIRPISRKKSHESNLTRGPQHIFRIHVMHCMKIPTLNRPLTSAHECSLLAAPESRQRQMSARIKRPFASDAANKYAKC